eukprot:SAG11_NODE_1968_length_3986_cov_5.572678_3_plen_741_part_00
MASLKPLPVLSWCKGATVVASAAPPCVGTVENGAHRGKKCELAYHQIKAEISQTKAESWCRTIGGCHPPSPPGASPGLKWGDPAIDETKTTVCLPPSLTLPAGLSIPGPTTLEAWLRPKPRKRAAVAFSGMFRNNEAKNTRLTIVRTMHSYVKHFVRTNPDYDIDFFFHIYIIQGQACTPLDVQSVEYVRRFPGTRGLISEIFSQDIVDEMRREFGERPMEPYCVGYNQQTDCPKWLSGGECKLWNCGKAYNFGFLSHNRKVWLANEMVKMYSAKNKVTYDYVVAARLDRFLGADLKLSSLPPGKLVTPKSFRNCHGCKEAEPHWMEDQFGVGPPAIINKYTSVWKELKRLYQESQDLWKDRLAWRADTSNKAINYFCQEWLLPRLISRNEHHSVHFPIRCWESAHVYSKTEMATWRGDLSKVIFDQTCSKSPKSGHKLVKADPMLMTWGEEQCTFLPVPNAPPPTTFKRLSWGDERLDRTSSLVCSPPTLPIPPTLTSSGPSTLQAWLRPKPTARAAVAFYGTFRSSAQLTVAHVMKSYIKHLVLANPDTEVDFFFHVYMEQGNWQSAQLKEKEWVQRYMPSLRGFIAESLSQAVVDSISADFAHKPPVSVAPSPAECEAWIRDRSSPIRCDCIKTRGTLSRARKLYLANKLMQEYTKQNEVFYSHVVAADVDGMLSADVVIPALSTGGVSLATTILASEASSAHWLDGLSVVGTAEAVDQYANLWEDLKELYANECQI